MGLPTASDPHTPDYLLLKAVARWQQRPEDARTAMTIFYNRYAADLLRRCWRFRGRFGGSSGVDDLVAEVFSRARRGAATYVPNPHIDRIAESRVTLGWLNQIAVNLYVDKVRADKKFNIAWEREAYDFKKELGPRPTSQHDSNPKSSERVQRLAAATEALALLSDRDQDILLVSLDWYDRGQLKFSDVPSDVIATLRDRYSITPDNYRQIRDRALKKVKAYILQAA